MSTTFEVLTILAAAGLILGTIGFRRFCLRLERDMRDAIALVLRTNDALVQQASELAEAKRGERDPENRVSLDRRSNDRRCVASVFEPKAGRDKDDCPSTQRQAGEAMTPMG